MTNRIATTQETKDKTQAAILKERDNWKRTAATWETVSNRRKAKINELQDEIERLKGVISNNVNRSK